MTPSKEVPTNDQRRAELLLLLPGCTQCGRRFADDACGLGHAMIQGAPEMHRSFDADAEADPRVTTRRARDFAAVLRVHYKAVGRPNEH